MNAHDPRDTLRVPPQSVEAECAVLGGLMLAPLAWSEVSDLLHEGDFYRRDHELIFRAIKYLEGKSRPFDAVTLADWFEAQGLAEQVAGGAYLVELASTTPSAANIRAYAEIVADKSRLRRLIEVGTAMVNDGFEPKGRDSVEIIGGAQTAVAALLDSEVSELEETTPIMDRVFGRLQERYSRGGGIDGLSTGLQDVDVILNGLKPGLYVLAARPKAGKTTLAQNIAEHVAMVCKKRVDVFSFEMQPEALGERMLASIGDVDASRLRSGNLDDTDWANVSSAMRRIKAAPIRISRPKSARVEHVVAQVRRQHSKKPVGLVVIDYLQLMETSGAENRTQGVGDITRQLALMAGQLGIPVLLLSQLSRKLEERGDKRPIPSDLRDSGSIEQDADAVIFIYRDEVYHPKSREKGTAEIIVALQRNGPSDTARVKYRPDRFRFEDLPEGWEPDPLPESKKRVGGFRRGGNAAADKAAGDDA